MDALDECPIDTGTPSAREEVLDLVEDLVQSGHSNLFICVTSRPEPDIQTVLNPLTSASSRVSLMKKVGRRMISTTISILSFTRIERCGDGETRTENSSSTFFQNELTGCEILPLLYPVIAAHRPDRFRWVFLPA